VNALDAAMRLALGNFFSATKEGPTDRLQSAHPRHRHWYGGKTRVLITSSDGKREWARSRERKHHRGEFAGAGGFDGVRAVEEIIDAYTARRILGGMKANKPIKNPKVSPNPLNARNRLGNVSSDP